MDLRRELRKISNRVCKQREIEQQLDEEYFWKQNILWNICEKIWSGKIENLLREEAENGGVYIIHDFSDEDLAKCFVVFGRSKGLKCKDIDVGSVRISW